MTFEDWIRTQIEAGAENATVSLGMARDKSEASLMIWSDKTPGCYFWKVVGEHVTLLQFIGSDEPLAEPELVT